MSAEDNKIIDDLMMSLRRKDWRIIELEEGACRQNCRSAKENWMQGYIEAQHNAARGVTLDAQEAWKDVRKGQQETAAKDK